MDEKRPDDELDRRFRAGDPGALAELFTRNRDRLKALVRLRMDRRLMGRVSPSDVLQEAFLDASQRFVDYGSDPSLPPYLWLRFLTVQRLLLTHRRHLAVQARDAARDRPVGGEAGADTVSVAEGLVGHLTSPTQAAARNETCAMIRELLEALDPLDREILALRHYEELSNGEAAAVLGLSKSAASNRYVRALGRLKKVLAGTLDRPVDDPTPPEP